MYFISFLILLFFLGVTLILPVTYLLTKKKIYLNLFLGIWGVIIVIICILFVNDFINSKTKVDKKDIYGTYVVDRKMFKGKNANWQYEHFTYKIKENNDFTFYEYFNNGSIKSIHKGRIKFVDGYTSPHLMIINLAPNHQVVDKEPLLVRSNWNFYYVFKSKKFGNMFFIKKKHGIFSNFEN
ncbi:hypothetical protein [Chryseobacterium sp.]|uniref:hypothetical protein n=1 Tax=Chryseobacterium sp. TaxID=1871047 RepID=UPI0011C803A6|nr:hypothetical protein [Chryseobacterium sp.]TXF76370.1 hypothetical protein FUA25_10830 [Chryseobacterium sp.]